MAESDRTLTRITAEFDKTAISAVSAVSRVFGIPELLEAILLYVAQNSNDQWLDHMTDGFPVLFRLQRVDIRFSATIRDSVRLQHRMYLRAMANTSEVLPRATLERLIWFLVRVLDLRVECTRPTNAELAKYGYYLKIRRMVARLEQTEPTPQLIDMRQLATNKGATWRNMQLYGGTGKSSICIRLRVHVVTRPPLQRVVARYTVQWPVNDGDTLGLLFDRYLDVLSRSDEEHLASAATYRLLRENAVHYG